MSGVKFLLEGIKGSMILHIIQEKTKQDISLLKE